MIKMFLLECDKHLLSPRLDLRPSGMEMTADRTRERCFSIHDDSMTMSHKDYADGNILIIRAIIVAFCHDCFVVLLFHSIMIIILNACSILGFGEDLRALVWLLPLNWMNCCCFSPFVPSHDCMTIIQKIVFSSSILSSWRFFGIGEECLSDCWLNVAHHLNWNVSRKCPLCLKSSSVQSSLDLFLSLDPPSHRQIFTKEQNNASFHSQSQIKAIFLSAALIFPRGILSIPFSSLLSTTIKLLEGKFLSQISNDTERR